MATLYLDLESGNDSNDGTSFANRKKTLSGASAIAQPGDTVRIMSSTTPNSLGVNGTFAKGSPKITLASAVNATIENCESAWTASANVTTTTSLTRKQGSLSTSIAPAAAFTTGLAAYKAMSATDFSAYQQISFWFQQTSGTLSGFDLKLCSDAAGATPVSTFSIPAPVALSGWNRVTVNLGSAMGASIQSVAFYVTADNGAQTYLLDNIVACKAPGTGELTHKTLIGKANSLGAGGDDSETWYAIRAIEGTTITLDLLNSSNAGGTANGRYWGTSETVTAYSMFPSYVPTSVVSADLQWTSGGTDVSRITISGGWNRTDMSTQTGETWVGIGYAPSSGLTMLFVASYLDISEFCLFGMTSSSAWLINNCTVTRLFCVSLSGLGISGVGNVLGVVAANLGGSFVFSGANTSGTIDFRCDQVALSITGTGNDITVNNSSVMQTLSVNTGSRSTFNGTTYGSFGDASAADAVMASTGDTSITLAKALEMLAAFMTGKVSVSSAAGISTYTYKKRDGTTTSFTSLCSETDGTRATTGALS